MSIRGSEPATEEGSAKGGLSFNRLPWKPRPNQQDRLIVATTAAVVETAAAVADWSTLAVLQPCRNVPVRAGRTIDTRSGDAYNGRAFPRCKSFI